MRTFWLKLCIFESFYAIVSTMPANHLTYFKVENFKKFESLELKDIGQFNLVTGDNNVGKTSLLEALTYTTSRRSCLLNFHLSLIKRGIGLTPKFSLNESGERTGIDYPEENLFKFLSHNDKKDIVIDAGFLNDHSEKVIIKYIPIGSIKYMPIKSNLGIQGYEYLVYQEEKFIKEPNDGRFVNFSSGGGKKGQMNNIQNESSGLFEHIFGENLNQLQVPLIYTALPEFSDLLGIYLKTLGPSRKAKKELVDLIRSVFLPNLEDIEVRQLDGGNFIFFAFKDSDLVEPMSTYGESVIRLFHIALQLQLYKGQRLMIDEIDTSIHHSRMKGFLKAVIKAAELNEVQLFMTTHSLECQQQFVEVFEEPDMAHLQKTVRNFTLVEDGAQKIAAVSFDFEQLQYALETDFDTRGAKRG